MNELDDTFEFVSENLGVFSSKDELFVRNNIMDQALRPLANVAEIAAKETDDERDQFLELAGSTVDLFRQHGKSNPLKDGAKFDVIERAFPDDFTFDYREMPLDGDPNFAIDDGLEGLDM